MLQAVIVTAEKVPQVAQSVPMSLSAVTGADLQRNGVRNIADLGRLVPGVSVQRTGPGENTVVIEGVSTTSSVGGMGSASTIGYYYGEVPFSTPIDLPMYDLNRIEVLRGPQGTLYGSSSMGGTIKYVPNEPVLNQFSATVGADTDHIQHSDGLGNTLYAVVNLPLEEKLAARALVFYKHQQGYLDRYPIPADNYLGVDTSVSPYRGVNSYDYYGYQLQLKYKPWSNVTILPLFLSIREGSAGISTVDLPQDNLAAGQLIQTRDSPEPSTYDTNIANLVIDASFGVLNLVSSTAYVKNTSIQTEDLSKTGYLLWGAPPGLPVVPEPIFNYFEPSQLVEEFRISGEVGRFAGTLGLYYNRTRYPFEQTYPFTRQWLAAYGDPVAYFGNGYQFFNTLFWGRSYNVNTERSIFTQETLRLTDKLSVTAGVRSLHYDVSGWARNYGALNGPETYFQAQQTSTGVTPKFNISYHLTPNKMVYATVAKGLRTGGIQSPSPEVCASALAQLGITKPPSGYAPDSLWNYELGAKTGELNGRMTLNGSAYYIDWTGIQQIVELECGFPFTSNFGKASVKGGDLELRAIPIDPLVLYASLSYTDAKLTNTVAGTGGSAGDPLLYVPLWSAAVSAEYRRHLTDSVNGYVHIGASYVDKIYRDFTPGPFQVAPSYYLLDLRAGARGRDGKWNVTAYVDNLLNKIGQSGQRLSISGANLPDTRSVAIIQPRTVGLEVQWNMK